MQDKMVAFTQSIIIIVVSVQEYIANVPLLR